MKNTIKLLWLAAVCCGAGCVHTVTENQPGQGPGYRDKLEATYQKPVGQVYEASKKALNSFGNITTDGQVYVGTNQAHIVEGQINGRSIYMRVTEIAPRTTALVVQVRTKMGGTDLAIAKDLMRQVGAQLSD